jgi:hypothetical protein
MMKMKFTINIYTEITNTISSQYKIISKSVLAVWDVSFPSQRNNQFY